jgi:hypothetical protein
LIAYHHGTVEILNRAGLEKAACECYHVIRSHCERLLPRPVDDHNASPAGQAEGRL